jgi:hypothetical protein
VTRADLLPAWKVDRARVAAQHPHPAGYSRRGEKFSVGDHYRRRNNGIALRTFRAIAGRP